MSSAQYVSLNRWFLGADCGIWVDGVCVSFCVIICVSVCTPVCVDSDAVEYALVTPPVTSSSESIEEVEMEEEEEMVAVGSCIVTEGGMYKGEASNRPACSLIAAATVLFASSSLRT